MGKGTYKTYGRGYLSIVKKDLEFMDKKCAENDPIATKRLRLVSSTPFERISYRGCEYLKRCQRSRGCSRTLLSGAMILSSMKGMYSAVDLTSQFCMACFTLFRAANCVFHL
jgi:hypothetical protein